MNHWTNLSIEYANQRSYLDDLFVVYPTIPDGIRTVDNLIWSNIEAAYKLKDNEKLLYNILKLDLSPVKDSYIAYLKRDPSSIERNPQTINRLCGRLYELGLEKLYERATEPKETNRQIGPFFKRWINKKTLGIAPVKLEVFVENDKNAVLDASDAEMLNFAKENLNYTRDKGLDFIARFNGKYVIGEAKFLTDFGGHQNAQFNDAISTITQEGVKAITVAVLDGVLYIKGKNKMYKELTEKYSDYNILSALVLRDFLYQI
jgi:hypothetical protein